MGKLLPHVFFAWKNRRVLEGANGITQIKTGKSQVQVGISQVQEPHRKFNPALRKFRSKKTDQSYLVSPSLHKKLRLVSPYNTHLHIRH